MQLIEVLLIAVSILAILAGMSVAVGSSKQNKSLGIWFFLATIGAAIWCVSIAWFLLLDPSQIEISQYLIIGIIGGITMCDVSLLGYCGWQQKGGKLATTLFGLGGIAIVLLLALNPSIFYSDISLNYTCNQLTVVKSWYYGVLIAFFTLISVTFSSFLSKRIKKEANKSKKFGFKVFYVGLTLGGILALVFDLILLSSVPSLIWIGPMATVISILSFYYSIIKYRSISLTTKSMRIMSYSILCASGVIIYILAFYAVFASIFHQQNPSFAVVLLNLIMLILTIAISPAVREISGIVMGMVNTSKIQFEYIYKKLAKINGTNVNLKELAGFLADNLHYEYVAIIVDGHIYGSSGVRFSADEIVSIEHIENTNNSIWLPIDRSIVKIVSSYDVSRIGELRKKDGSTLGQVVFGKKLTKTELDREDLIQYETIINYTAMVIENGSRKS